ncbi:hypothetical protein WH47_10979 [Habropoda laboriosa]|uniref:Uncharacterized protein n=1 Tax=Habropoda laboriosa TaxID=597456 RepID=A0A0L7R9H9_9HYME|nr:hypothetical protein WH47_10979 [Habropoda laboriosa]
MDQFITTYSKDYTWPSTRIKHTPGLSEDDSCRCHKRPKEIKPIERCGDDYDWSRTGPMGRLLDPKLYPAKTGPSPESEATKFDQPSTYMKKSTPMDEVIKRVDEDRLKSTYQIDYSEKAAAQMAEVYSGPCTTMKHEEKLDCRPSAGSRLTKRKRDEKDSKKKTGKKTAEEDSQETRLPPWRSEYQDSISKLGQAIVKSKMHTNKTEAPAWATAV